MDPVTHTLTGAVLGKAGLGRRTGLAMATLMIGANFPDIDILAVPFGHNLEFRRGWTHGILAMVVLPFVLTGMILAWDRLVRRRGGRVPERPVIASQVLLLATIAMLSHPLLDLLNTYGVRLLMPFASTWFEGDALYIVDPWVLLALVIGLVAAGWSGARRARARDAHAPARYTAPAQTALALFALYATAMMLSSAIGRAHVRESLRARGIEHGAIMVSPTPGNPFRREVVVTSGDRYLLGEFTWLPRHFVLTGAGIPRNASHPLAREAARTDEGRRFLGWSRFPYFVIDETADETRVHIADLRYAADPRDSWAALTVVLGRRDRQGQ